MPVASKNNTKKMVSHWDLRRFFSLGIGAIIATLCLHPIPVFAHDSVIGGSPADGSVVDSSPAEIVLEFSGEPKEGFNTIAVTDQAGEVVFRGEPTVEGRNVILEVPDDVTLGPGDYTIGFQITSSDGHSTRGKTTFSVSETGGTPVASGTETQVQSANATSKPTVEDEDTSNSQTTYSQWAMVGVGIGLLLVVAAITLVVMRIRQGKR